jgi:hypothetical protein
MQESGSGEAFGYLHKSLVEFYERYIDGCLKATGFFVIVLGWLVTSKDAHAFLVANPEVRKAAALATLLPAVAFAVLCARLMVVMRHLGRELRALDYFPPAYYEHYVLKLPYAISLMILGISPCIIIVFLLLREKF